MIILCKLLCVLIDKIDVSSSSGFYEVSKITNTAVELFLGFGMIIPWSFYFC